jgi:predicted RNA-binding Zn ribbon-like protein
MTGSTAFQRSRGKLYAETFRCPGGALCLDFCNSGQGARRASGDWIAGFPELIDWLEAAGAVTTGQAARLRRAGAASPRAATQVWRRAIKFREALFRVLKAKAEGGKVAREDLSDIEAEHARAVSFARLSWIGEAYRWSLDPSAARRRAAASGRIGGEPAHVGEARAAAPLRKFNLLLAVHRRDPEPQPALV